MRVQIYIDGGNLYHLALKPLGIQSVEFDFDAFAAFLADGRTISEMGKRYYIGTVREKENDERSKQAMGRQVELFNELKKTAWEIKTSKLRERTERIIIDNRVANYQAIRRRGINEIVYQRLREKGIDVKIATDLVAGALDDKYDVAILVSSDSDLMPMVDWIRCRLKKRIEYVGFSIPDVSGRGEDIRPTQALISRTDVQRVLIESDVRKFKLPVLGFAKQLVPLVKDGSKILTYRLGLKYDFLQNGDTILVEDSSTRVPFAKIKVVRVSKTAFADLPIDRRGHEAYASKSEQREVFEGFYKRVVNDTEQVLIIEFKILKLLPN